MTPILIKPTRGRTNWRRVFTNAKPGFQFLCPTSIRDHAGRSARDHGVCLKTHDLKNGTCLCTILAERPPILCAESRHEPRHSLVIAQVKQLIADAEERLAAAQAQHAAAPSPELRTDAAARVIAWRSTLAARRAHLKNLQSAQ